MSMQQIDYRSAGVSWIIVFRRRQDENARGRTLYRLPLKLFSPAILRRDFVEFLGWLRV